MSNDGKMCKTYGQHIADRIEAYCSRREGMITGRQFPSPGPETDIAIARLSESKMELAQEIDDLVKDLFDR